MGDVFDFPVKFFWKFSDQHIHTHTQDIMETEELIKLVDGIYKVRYSMFLSWFNMYFSLSIHIVWCINSEFKYMVELLQ